MQTSELRDDVRFALRVLRRDPGFTIIAALTIAIAVGASTAIFSVVESVLLRALPYSAGDRTFVLWNSGPDNREFSVSPAEFADIAEQQRALDGLAAISPQPSNLTGDGEPERVTAYAVSPDLFRLLGAQPAMGRGFLPEDGVRDAQRVIVLSHGLWTRRFGADKGIIGRVVNVNGLPRTVVGVMPPDVRFPDAPVGFLKDRGDLWIPFDWTRNRAESRGNQYLAVIAKLKPGETQASLARDLAAIERDFRQRFPRRYEATWRFMAVPLNEQMFGAIKPVMLVLSAAVGLVLLIACVNVANLMLARSAARRQEMAVRGALGAGRGRLIRQLLTEGLVLALAGGASGVLVAMLGVKALVRLDPGNIPRLGEAGVNGGVLLFCLGVSLTAGLLFGLVPAVQQSRENAQETLRAGSRSIGSGRWARQARTLLVSAELAMAFVVLVGAGLLLRSVAALQRVEIGFRPGGVMTAQLSLPAFSYDSAWKVRQFYQQLTTRLGEQAGIEGVAGIYPLPMSGEQWSGSFGVNGVETPPGEQEPHAEYAVVTPGYFRTVGMKLHEGRDFAATDVAGGPQVVVIDESLARHHWPGESAVGKRLDVWGDSPATVIGVVGHVRTVSVREVGEPQIYTPHTQNTQRAIWLVARGAADPAAVVSALRSQVRAMDRSLPLASVASLDDVVARATARDRFNTALLGVFAGVALVLSAVGLYGVMAQLVSQRRHEIGIRVALGARRGAVLQLVVGEGMAITAVGLVGGALAAVAVTRLASGLLFGVSPSDPLTYAMIGGTLALVALAASYIPARRAAGIAPIEAMRM